jgi:hypothetical protein
MTAGNRDEFAAALKSALLRLPLPENYYRGVFQRLKHP